MKQLEYHEAANIFPLMEGDPYEEFKASVEADGQEDPIVLYEGKILDGRNRYRACVELGKTPKTTEWKGKGSPVAYVMDHNLHRRHLTESQRAMVAGHPLTFTYYQEEAEKRKVESGKEAGKRGGRGHKKGLAPIDTDPLSADSTTKDHRYHGKASQAAGHAVSVSPASVDRARRVHTEGVPALAEAVNSGTVSVTCAADVARLPREEQEEALAGGKTAMKEAAKRAVPPKRKAKTKKRKTKPNKLIKAICDKLDQLVEAVRNSEMGASGQRIERIKYLTVAKDYVREAAAFLTK